MALPTAYDYATLAPHLWRAGSIADPQGRETTGELAWRGPLFGGVAAASLFYRVDPGHVVGNSDDKGAALKWMRQF